MKKLLFSLAASMAYCLIFSCQPAPKEETAAVFDPASAGPVIDSLNKKFSDYLKAGDSASIAALYSNDALLFLPNQEPVPADHLAALMGGMIHMGVTDLGLKTTQLSGDSSWLVETGSYSMKTGNNVEIEKGNYVVVWKKDNGNWKIFRDAPVVSTPPPPAKK